MQRQNSFTKEELLKCGRGEMFGAGNAQLPLPPMLMFDRIVSITEEGGKYGNGQIIAELDIKPDLWFFDCHFTGDPVMPGCLGLDAMWQLVGFYLGWMGGPGRGRALGAGEPLAATATVTVPCRVDMQSAKISIESDDRRWFCVWSHAPKMVDGRPLWNWYKSGGYAACAAWLRARLPSDGSVVFEDQSAAWAGMAPCRTARPIRWWLRPAS